MGSRMLFHTMGSHGMSLSPAQARPAAPDSSGQAGQGVSTARLTRSDSMLLAVYEMEQLKENSTYQCKVEKGDADKPNGMQMVRRTQKAVADLEVDILDQGEAQALDSATAQKLRWVQKNNKGSSEKLTPQNVREAQRRLARRASEAEAGLSGST